MSDFIARIAARSVGQAPVARPRVASAFESAGPAGDVGIDVFEAEAPAPTGPAPEATPPRPAGGEVRAASAGAAAAAPRSEPAAPERVTAATRLVRDRLGPVESGQPVARGPKLVSAAPGASGHEQHVPAAAPEAAFEAGTAAVAVAVARPAAPARPRRAAAPEAGPEAAPGAPGTADVEAPAVRVHIGRLEVRANLQPPAQPQRRVPEGARPQELSLSDYLRGKRVRA